MFSWSPFLSIFSLPCAIIWKVTHFIEGRYKRRKSTVKFPLSGTSTKADMLLQLCPDQEPWSTSIPRVHPTRSCLLPLCSANMTLTTLLTSTSKLIWPTQEQCVIGRDRAQLVKCSTCKLRNWIRSPKPRWGWWHTLVNPSTGEVEAGWFLGLTGRPAWSNQSVPGLRETLS